eukprot:s3520_g9.t1
MRRSVAWRKSGWHNWRSTERITRHVPRKRRCSVPAQMPWSPRWKRRKWNSSRGCRTRRPSSATPTRSWRPLWAKRANRSPPLEVQKPSRVRRHEGDPAESRRSNSKPPSRFCRPARPLAQRLSMADLDAEALRQQLAEAEEEYQEIHQELAHSQLELQEARRCGGQLLSAAEAALAPLMLELARAREATDLLLPPVLAQDEVKETSTTAPSLSSREAIEAEIKHLKLDIDHFKNVAARLQTEDTQRYYVMNSLRNELTEATEELGYQRDRARHHEVSRSRRIRDRRRSLSAGWAQAARSLLDFLGLRAPPSLLRGVAVVTPGGAMAKRCCSGCRSPRRGAQFAVVKRHRELLLLPFKGSCCESGLAPGPVHRVSQDQLRAFGSQRDREAAVFGLYNWKQHCARESWGALK